MNKCPPPAALPYYIKSNLFGQKNNKRLGCLFEALRTTDQPFIRSVYSNHLKQEAGDELGVCFQSLQIV